MTVRMTTLITTRSVANCPKRCGRHRRLLAQTWNPFPPIGIGERGPKASRFPRPSGAMTLRKIQTVVSATACPRASFRPRSWPATTQHDYSQIQAPVLAFVGYPGLPQDGIRDNHVTGPGERTI